MPAFLRYTRLWFSFARFALLGELAFRANFLLKMTVEVLWLCILLMFYETMRGLGRVSSGIALP